MGTFKPPYKWANSSTLSVVQPITAQPVPDQGPSMLKQARFDSPWTGPTSFSNSLTFKFKTSLPTSVEYARQAAEQSHLSQPPPCQHPCGASSTSVGPVGQPEDQILDELRVLARWPPLRNALQPPIVGDLESDPSGVADRHGVKGMPVLTAFFNMDLKCHVCPYQAETVQLAVLHQQQARHFQS